MDKAIQYFKQVTLSTPKGVQERAESSFIDTPMKGEGYELGAREIEEENGILQILDALENEINPHFKWVLVELFVSDDIHYLDKYACYFGKIITDLENNNSDEIDFLLNRLVVVIDTKIDKPFQNEFIQYLISKVSPKISLQIEKLLIDAGLYELKADETTNTELADSFNEFRKKNKKEPVEDVLETYVKKAKEELFFGNKTKARSLIQKGWQKKGEDKLSIFDGRPEESLKVLVEASNSIADILTACEDIILNDPYKAEWVLAAKLIPLLSQKMESTEKQKMLQTVESHLELMVRTSEQNPAIFDRYNWLKESSQKDNVNSQIAEFIIWLLNYPNFNSDKTIIELLTWLCSVEPEIIIPLLIEEAFGTKPNISAELSIYTLYSAVSEGHSAIIWKHLKKKEMNILSEDHFMKKYALLKILILIANSDADAIPILEGLKATFPQELLASADVEPEWSWLPPIAISFDNLAFNGFINGKLCGQIENSVKELCNQLGIEEDDLSRINQYYKRSFFNQKNFLSPVENIPRYALNKAMSKSIPLNQIETGADELSLIYNFFN